MKKVFLFTLIVICCNTYSEEKVSKSLAIEYLRLSQFEETINATIQQYESQLSATAKPEEKAEIHKMFVGSMGWEKTKDQLADVVISTYTKEEIDAAIAYMKSTYGASVQSKNGEFARKYTSLVSENLQKV